MRQDRTPLCAKAPPRWKSVEGRLSSRRRSGSWTRGARQLRSETDFEAIAIDKVTCRAADHAGKRHEQGLMLQTQPSHHGTVGWGYGTPLGASCEFFLPRCFSS